MKNSTIRMLRDMFAVDKSYMLVSLLGIINPLIDIYFLNIFLKSISEEKSISKAASTSVTGRGMN